MEECASDVVLTTMPSVSGCVVEDNAEGVEANSRGECVAVVKARYLRETLCNKSRLVPYDLAVGTVLDNVCPSTANDLSIFWSVDEFSCAAFLQESKFLMHGLPPLVCLRTRSSLSEVLRSVIAVDRRIRQLSNVSNRG